MGLRFEARDPGRASALGAGPPGPFVATLPSVSIGLRSDASGGWAPGGTLLERARSSPAVRHGLVSRVGIEWTPAQPQVAFVRDGLGIRLGGDDRLTMRLRKGALGIYMRRDF